MRSLSLLLVLLLPSIARAETTTAAFSVVLDPGHGGDDTGIRRDPLMEKSLTLEVARSVGKIFEGRSDRRVILTRNADLSVPLNERKRIANEASPGIFISIHFARSPSPESGGPHVYVLAAPKVGGTTSPLNVEEAHAKSLGESWKLAALSASTLSDPPGSARIAPLPLAPLLGVTLPSILIELDALSSKEAARWQDPATIDDAAHKIAAAIDRYLAGDSSLDRIPPPGKNPPP
jgi:N-acetylmuramoyl-L-alanine amidase